MPTTILKLKPIWDDTENTLVLTTGTQIVSPFADCLSVSIAEDDPDIYASDGMCHVVKDGKTIYGFETLTEQERQEIADFMSEVWQKWAKRA